MKLAECSVVAALVAVVAVPTGRPSAAPARAGARLDDETVQAFGGTYAADCRKPGVRVVVAADTMAVEAGAKRVESHDVQRAVTYAGGAQPAGYQGSLLGDVPGGEPLVFHVHRDAHGVYLLVDADTKLESTFGRAALAPKFRSCDGAAKPASPGKPASPRR